MVIIYSAKNDREFEIIEATLLSEAELQECKDYVTCPAYFEPHYWYLRDACEDNMIAMACDNMVDEPSEPDYEDFPPYGPAGTGLRPILRIKPTQNVKPGDKITITSSGYLVASFTAISNTILLSDFMIDYDHENNSYGIFDQNTNIYEDSRAKRRVNDWYESILNYIHDTDDKNIEDDHDNIEDVSNKILTKNDVINLFGSPENIETVVIPENISVIGKHAFYGCTNLRCLKVHKGLEIIEDEALSNTSKYIKIAYEGTGSQWEEIPKGEDWQGQAEVEVWSQELIDLFGWFDIKSSTNEQRIDVDKSNTIKTPPAINWDFFEFDELFGKSFITKLKNNYLEAITVPEGVDTIGESAFEKSKIKNIFLPNSLIEIRNFAFRDCTALTEITIPKSVTRLASDNLGGWVFDGCTSLKRVSLSTSLKAIQFATFRNCSSLTEIKIPESVTKIESYAFEGCSSLTKVVLPKSLREIWGDAFKGCSSLTEIDIPNTINEIGECAFKGCKKLTKVVLPANITIRQDAFDDTCQVIFK